MKLQHHDLIGQLVMLPGIVGAAACLPGRKYIIRWASTSLKPARASEPFWQGLDELFDLCKLHRLSINAFQLDFVEHLIMASSHPSGCTLCAVCKKDIAKVTLQQVENIFQEFQSLDLDTIIVESG